VWRVRVAIQYRSLNVAQGMIPLNVAGSNALWHTAKRLCYDICSAIDNQRIIQSTAAIFFI
jgi:hypothetical protein